MAVEDLADVTAAGSIGQLDRKDDATLDHGNLVGQDLEEAKLCLDVESAELWDWQETTLEFFFSPDKHRNQIVPIRRSPSAL